MLISFRYVHFDFHQVCHGGNFDNLQVLYNQIEEYIQKQGYFLNTQHFMLFFVLDHTTSVISTKRFNCGK
jgi:hypothetical protein